MKYQKAIVAIIDLGEEEILTNSGHGCDNHGHADVHPNCTNHGNQNANNIHYD